MRPLAIALALAISPHLAASTERAPELATSSCTQSLLEQILAQTPHVNLRRAPVALEDIVREIADRLGVDNSNLIVTWTDGCLRWEKTESETLREELMESVMFSEEVSRRLAHHPHGSRLKIVINRNSILGEDRRMVWIEILPEVPQRRMRLPMQTAGVVRRGIESRYAPQPQVQCNPDPCWCPW